MIYTALFILVYEKTCLSTSLFLSSNNLHIYILLFFTNDLRWVTMDRAGKIPSPSLQGLEKVTPKQRMNVSDKITVKKQKRVFKVLICLCAFYFCQFYY